MQTVFENNNSDKLILFFSGWGMDEKPFKAMKKSGYDILHVFNYSELELDFDFSKYKKIVLISFSYGVFMAGYLQEVLPKLDLKIAVNGTLKPIDDEFGIPEKVFDLTLSKIDETNFLKFRRRLFNSNEDYNLFNKYQPSRTLEDSMLELSRLQSYSRGKDVDFAYDKVLISSADKIIPSKNQMSFWKNHKHLKIVDKGHFSFYKFDSIDDIIGL